MKRLVTEASGALRVEDVVDAAPGPRTSIDPPVAERAPVSLRHKISAYIALTKPRIIELLLVTTVPAMILAERGMPSPTLILLTLIGGTLSAGGANAINCYIDRDIDRIMTRTKRRPLPAHKVQPRPALMFGMALGGIAFVFMALTINVLAASLSLAALLFYVFVYTLALKRSTPQNIVIGGAAGAMPVLVGWAAVTGTVDLPALAMFGIVFYWTPPHFWALAMRYEDEYAAAKVPMMPVVYGKTETTRHILLYSFMLFALCLIMFSVGRLGVVYLVAALVLNGLFIAKAVKLLRRPEPRIAWDLFRYSITYLALLFAAIAVDQFVPSL